MKKSILLQLTSLDVSANTALAALYCFDNSLTGLDVSANAALTILSCYSNSITSLDVSANAALTELFCYSNSLTSLDVSTPSLFTLHCDHNHQLTTLDVSANTALSSLYCANNYSLTGLDVSANTALVNLICSYNSFTSLDVSANTELTYLDCSHSSLTALNIKNGNISDFQYMHANNNPSLTCIQVDNVSIANYYDGYDWHKDATASFSTNCGFASVSDIDQLAAVQIFPNPANGFVTIKGLNTIQTIELITMQGQLIKTILVNGNSSSIDVSTISNGIYLLKLSSGNQTKTERLVVAH